MACGTAITPLDECRYAPIYMGRSSGTSDPMAWIQLIVEPMAAAFGRNIIYFVSGMAYGRINMAAGTSEKLGRRLLRALHGQGKAESRSRDLQQVLGTRLQREHRLNGNFGSNNK